MSLRMDLESCSVAGAECQRVRGPQGPAQLLGKPVDHLRSSSLAGPGAACPLAGWFEMLLGSVKNRFANNMPGVCTLETPEHLEEILV